MVILKELFKNDDFKNDDFEKKTADDKNSMKNYQVDKEIITILHECLCRIEISHPRGLKFNQRRGLQSPLLNSDPDGDISLSYMNMLLIDCFSPTFPRCFVGT